jgi:hypothetical protein
MRQALEWKHEANELTMNDEKVILVRVGFNQQQRELIERLKSDNGLDRTDSEIVRDGFVQWLRDEGRLSK